MRDEGVRIRDNNAARLIRAALPVEAQLDADRKRALRLRLAGDLRELQTHGTGAFPRIVLILLAGAAGLLSLGALYDLAMLRVSLSDLPTELGAALALNLAAVPAALFIRARNRRKSDA